MNNLKKVFSMLVMLLALTACFSNQQEIETLTDPYTEMTIDAIDENERAPGQVIVHHGSDNMDRGNYDLTGQIVVDLVYYDSNAIQRGEIVYYEPPKDMQERMGKDHISRVVGLPGESLKIVEGQIYIDGKLLDTFYGRAHRLGSDLDELENILQQKGLKDHIRQNIENISEYFLDANMDEISIPEHFVFVVGDDWLRSNDSKQFGPISMDSIGGKVLGEVAE